MKHWLIKSEGDCYSIHDLKHDPALAAMLVLQRGQRLSVMPVAKEHFERVVKMGA